MNIQPRPLSQISQDATQILYKELGVIETIRFINQFTTGIGDYTKDRHSWLGDKPVKDIISEIKTNRKPNE
ncbi:MAG: hypothetical protein O7D86_06110 [Proteobacteria bacterium]|nr:hypothetical protein [Pseudomonadota bacterium]